MEGEYQALGEAAREAMWYHNLFEDIGLLRYVG
jgi:hypothetical protein